MSESAAYLVEGKRLSADECRVLFARTSLLDRHLKVLGRIEGDTIIDIGCYSGLFVREASCRFPEKTIIGLDCSDDNIQIAHLLYPDMRARFRRMSVYHLEFPDANVDCITLQEVLEHLEGPAAALKEISRVLKPGGVLVISVPNPFYAWRMAKFVCLEISNSLRRWRGRPPHLGVEVLSESSEWDRHIYAWTPQTLLTLLTGSGFEYVDHCYETITRNRLVRLFLAVLPFFGPTQILKVRKSAAAARPV